MCVCLCVCLQVQTLSQEDLDAYLSQAVCLRQKSPQELQQIKVSYKYKHIHTHTHRILQLKPKIAFFWFSDFH